MLKKLLGFVLLSLACAPAYCAPAFTFENSPTIITNNSVSSYTIVSVQQCPSTDVNCAAGWRLFISSANYQIVSATSTDSQNWSFESGIRLSTPNYIGAISSMKGFDMYYEPHYSRYQAYFVGVNNTASPTTYTIMRATSTDQVSWGIDYTFGGMTQSNNTNVTQSPKVIRDTNGNVYLFYVQDSVGSGNPGDYRVYYSTCASYNYGNGFGAPTLAINTTSAYAVAISTLTDGSARLYMSASSALTASTSQYNIISAVTSALGPNMTFKTEGTYGTQTPIILLSTPAVSSMFTDFAVIRSSETYRWRLFANLRDGSTYYAQTALTYLPYPTGISPGTVYRTDTADNMTLSGEVFSPSSSVSVTNGSALLGVSGLTRNSDESLSFVLNSSGAALGSYSIIVTNADGRSSTLSNALYVDYLSGSVSVLDNLFRPLNGSTCKFTITAYGSGHLIIRAFTKGGQTVKHIYDAAIPDAYTDGEPFVVKWDGTTDAGHTVASGLYFVVITGPKINATEKVVVIK
jgi:hypothetical protein